MPFRFERMAEARVLLTNPAGEFIILTDAEFQQFTQKSLKTDSPLYLNLKSKAFLCHDLHPAMEQALASQWRTKKAFLEAGPRLHIFVPTLRCNQGCGYCQVSRADTNARGVDMSRADAIKAIETMLCAPSQHLSMEFQGGEPLLAFDMVAWMMQEANARARDAGKSLSFVICTNLTLLTERHLRILAKYKVDISTSLDGPADLHDRNRPMTGAAAHALVVENIRRCHELLGPGSVSALMTTTRHSLGRAQDILDEYLVNDLHSIFLRELNPYGFAQKSAKSVGYETAEFCAFYADALDRIMTLNRRGQSLREGYAALLLRKILTPFGVGFVDLQSPTGEGFGTLLYNHDGNIYASDEARMLAEMGDHSFRLGEIGTPWAELMTCDTMLQLASAGVAEALPGCSDCAFVPYCGADPIRHYRTQGDMVGHRPTSSFCQKQKFIFQQLFHILETADTDSLNMLLGWITPNRTRLPVPSWLK